MAIYALDGSIIEKDIRPTEWVYAAPDSVGRLLLEVTCEE